MQKISELFSYDSQQDIVAFGVFADITLGFCHKHFVSVEHSATIVIAAGTVS